jgi:hypothetical protein
MSKQTAKDKTSGPQSWFYILFFFVEVAIAITGGIVIAETMFGFFAAGRALLASLFAWLFFFKPAIHFWKKYASNNNEHKLNWVRLLLFIVLFASWFISNLIIFNAMITELNSSQHWPFG